MCVIRLSPPSLNNKDKTGEGREGWCGVGVRVRARARARVRVRVRVRVKA